jgi:hypothetical protein
VPKVQLLIARPDLLSDHHNRTSSPGTDRHQVSSPSAMAFSLCRTASSAFFGCFAAGSPNRNVTIVVSVLMISCQVLGLPSRKYDGNHNATRKTHMTKNQEHERKSPALVTKRLKAESLQEMVY